MDESPALDGLYQIIFQPDTNQTNIFSLTRIMTGASSKRNFNPILMKRSLKLYRYFHF